MSRHDPPGGVSALVVAAALALGGAIFVPALRSSEARAGGPAAACAPEGGAARAAARAR